MSRSGLSAAATGSLSHGSAIRERDPGRDTGTTEVAADRRGKDAGMRGGMSGRRRGKAADGGEVGGNALVDAGGLVAFLSRRLEHLAGGHEA